MAILQALLALISRSLGSILSALFGWAVVALFGETSPREKMWLSALVGAAAAWPLLVLGVVWPRVAALTLVFVPMPHWIPTWTIRAVWITLAVIVPFALGTAVAVRSRGAGTPIPGTAPAMGPKGALKAAVRQSPLRESKVVRLFRGIPITLAVAASFFIVFVTVPLRRLIAIARGQVDVYVPLVTDAKGYELVAKEIAETLGRHGLPVREVRPGWSVTAPTRILFQFGGPSFRTYVPQRLACFRGPRLEVLLYANGLALRGSERDTAWAHGLLVEALTDAPAYQTFNPEAQDIERQIRSVLAVFRQNPTAHAGSARLEARLEEIARDIRELPVGYDEWQIVYRQALQLDRALRGSPPLLEAVAHPHELGSDQPKEEAKMTPETSSGDGARALSIRALIAQIIAKATLLAKKEMELARTEVRADLQSELSAVKGLAVAGLALMLGLSMLLVALIFVLASYMAAWVAALVVGSVLLVTGAIVGYASWTRRVSSPLAVTRKTLKESTEWVKERLA
jgi:Putative Actinobacterial Holin-X, holin superfamily III